MTQQSASSSTVAPSGQFDTQHLWLETEASLVTCAMFTKVGNARWPFLADLVRFQCYFSIISKYHCNLSITGGHQHVVKEVCGVGVVVGASTWTLSS